MKSKGRPKNRTDIKHMLRIRLTEAERKTLDSHAKAKGIGTSTWARMELLEITSKEK
jgi:hypothetical protein